jgi:diaminopimelate decarboxylase
VCQSRQQYVRKSRPPRQGWVWVKGRARAVHGQQAVARVAGFPGECLMLHGNVKTAEDLKAALAAGVDRIVVDSVEEIETLGDLA